MIYDITLISPSLKSKSKYIDNPTKLMYFGEKYKMIKYSFCHSIFPKKLILVVVKSNFKNFSEHVRLLQELSPFREKMCILLLTL